MRKLVSDGKEAEHRLASYAAMRMPGNNAAAVVTALQAGMSTRSQTWASEGVMSKSAASRHWIEATATKITELRERASGRWLSSGSCSMACAWATARWW